MHTLGRIAFQKMRAVGMTLTAAITIGLAGCGGGGGGAAGGGAAGVSTASVTGQFVDAPVAGLGYKCGTSTTLSGTTDGSGYYTCKEGESVGFYVGDILLGSVASAQTVVTPLDLVGAGAKPTDTAVSNIVRFLLSISTTDSAGNLVIDAGASDRAAGQKVNFQTILANGLDSMITTVKPGVTPTTRAAAENHMRDSIYKLFAKSYAGTYGGVSSGVWNFAINAKDGSVTGTYTDADKSSGPISGQMSTDMSVSSTYGFTGTAGSNTWNGTLNVSTGVFNGTWDGGTFTGKVATPPATTKPTTTGITPNTGAVSSSVTITGTNLTSVTQVLFSLTSNINTFSAGAITAQTATGITATVPSSLAAGNYTVTVVHPGGEVTVGAFTATTGSGGSGGNTGSATLPTGFVARANPSGILNTPSTAVWTGTEFIALEQSTAFHTPTAKFFVWKSTDGITWTRQTTDLNSTFISLSTANGKVFQLTANFAVAGANPTVTIAQSSNGINWTSSTADYIMGSSVPSPMGVKYLNSRYFASLDVDTCTAISSADGATWTSVDLKALALPSNYYKEANSKFCSEPFYAGGKYRIYGGIITVFNSDPVVAKGLVYSSTDGTNWSVETFALPTGVNSVSQTGRTSTVVQVGNTIVLPSVMAQASRRINPTDAYATLVTDSNQVGTSTDGVTFTFANAVGITYRAGTIGKPGLTSYFPSIDVTGSGVLGMEGTTNFWTTDGVNYTTAAQGYGLTMTSINYAYSPTLKRLVVIQRGSGLKDPTIMTKDF